MGVFPPLTIYFTNDMHGEAKPLDRFKLEQPPPNYLLLDGGDAIKGSNTVFHLNEPILTQMRLCGYHAMAMGNRELHYWRWILQRRNRQRLFTLLASNLVDLHYTPYHWSYSTIIYSGKWRIGILGATVIQYPTGSPWEQLTGLRFLEPKQCLPHLAKLLKQKCHLVILLSHLGLDKDIELAPHLSHNIDLIVGGHSHDALHSPQIVQGVPIVQAGSHGKYLGRLQLIKHDKGIKLIDYKLIAT